MSDSAQESVRPMTVTLTIDSVDESETDPQQAAAATWEAIQQWVRDGGFMPSLVVTMSDGSVVDVDLES